MVDWRSSILLLLYYIQLHHQPPVHPLAPSVLAASAASSWEFLHLIPTHMATTVFRTTAIGAAVPPTRLLRISSKPSKLMAVSFRQGSFRPGLGCSLQLSRGSSLRFGNFVALAASGDTETKEVEIEEPQLEESGGDAVVTEDVAALSEDDAPEATEDSPDSAFFAALTSYREALSSNNESKAAEIEDYFKSIENERSSLETKVSALSSELSIERDRVLRISADFDNFRKRTERERLSLVSNAKGEVVENFLPVLDNFERAKTQIKVETEGEEKLNNSYQSIYKQFTEVLVSLGVVPVETVTNPFDPLLHEAIMREESTEYEEGIVLQEFRKGFKLGDRLLRPSMVKVSAGPGPTMEDAAESPPSEEAPAGETTESS